MLFPDPSFSNDVEMRLSDKLSLYIEKKKLFNDGSMILVLIAFSLLIVLILPVKSCLHTGHTVLL